MRRSWGWTFLLLAGISVIAGVAAHAAARPLDVGGIGSTVGADLRTFPCKYYVIHSDLPLDEVKEAMVRMDRMAEEYHARTAGFSGEIRQRLPFYLFKNAQEYYEAGGMPGSAGVFTEDRLMAIAGPDAHGYTWHIVQHEGFHQFAHAVIRGELPPWVNEGIAEYFGEGLFTGDGFITGVIPPARLKRLKDEINSGRLKSVPEMMIMSYAHWNSRLQSQNYDQAWSMVHFLAQGESGKFQQPFVAFMQAIGRGAEWEDAWLHTFGSAAGFEEKWKNYWLSLPDNPTADLYAEATAATLNSFLARAVAQRQHLSSMDEFFEAASSDHLKIGEASDDWLPPRLLYKAIETAKSSSDTQWSLEQGPDKNPRLTAVLPDGTRITGSYVLRAGHVVKAALEVDDVAKVVKEAKALIEQGNKDAARALLQKALRDHPKSPATHDAREALLATR